MNIIVCMKQVPDPEGPQDCFAINPETVRVEPRGIPPVLSLFDENALEAALRIKDDHGEEMKITLLTLGGRISNAVLQKGLAVGADDLVKVEGEAFDPGMLDSFGTASALAATIKRIGSYDLILAGRQAADWNAGQVGIFLGGILGLPTVTLAKKVDIQGEYAVVERLVPSGYETVRTKLPAVVVASNEVGELRYPTMIQRRQAKKKPVTAWGASDIGIEEVPKNRVVLKRLFAPEMRKGQCQLMEGETPDEAGINLAKRLRADGVL
jgi:electron transfer flavoprotein beta subunit